MKHGGNLSEAIERFGGSSSDWLDLSTGINPYAYPIPADLPGEVWQRLPDQRATDLLISAARQAYGCPDHIGLIPAPGTQILISNLPYILPEGPVVICGPTYSTHRTAFEQAGRAVSEVTSPHALPDGAQVAIIVNPNNPDGRLVDPSSLKEIARELTARGGALVLDEAFADVMPGASLIPHLKNETVAVLRSFGKFFGLAGLRLGFMAAPTALAVQMTNRLESWSVSGPALEIGQKALSDKSWQNTMVNQLSNEMADLTIALSENHLSVFGGTPLFALAAHRNAHALHEALAHRRIWTRIFDYAPTWLRFGLPGAQENQARLSNALAQTVKEL